MAGSFAGQFPHAIDSKGRVIIPVCYRDALGDSFTIALNSSLNAIALYPASKWEAISEQLSRVRDTDDEGMDYVRFIMSNAQTDTSMDMQGRILLPQRSRDMLALKKDVVFVGVRDYVEIWEAEAFAQKQQQTIDHFAALRRHVNDVY